MSTRRKVSINSIFAGLCICILILLTLQIKASHKNRNYFFKALTEADTVPPPNLQLLSANDTARTQKRDTTKRGKDTTVVTEFSIDSIKISKDSLDAPISYSASDSGVLIIPTKQFFLYNKAHITYKDIELNATVMRYDQSTQTILAYATKDSANPLAKATLKQGESSSQSDTILYNLKTQKGLTKNTFYQEQDYFVQTEIMKKVTENGDNVVYAYRNQFTTCNLDTPHFAFRTKKMKIIANKMAVSGPAHPEFEGVPVPLYIPFGIYPMKRGRHSGLLAPQFATNEDYGLGLEGLGYYKVLSDYIDVTVRTNIYSYGGWNLWVNPRYLRRYRYTGNFNLAVQHTKRLNNTADLKKEFSVSNSFNIGWSHSRDNKARPGTSFSASVNAGSTKFNRDVPNNTNLNFQNQLTSTIQWSKTTPKTNLTVAATHNQNNLTRLVNLNLPNATFSALTFYPFQKKARIGEEKWFEKLGISYNGSLQNQFSFYDTAFSFRQLKDTLQWGINHSIPITLALPSLGPVTLSPGINYSERWVGRRVTYTWNDATKQVDTVFSKGLYTPREVSFTLQANTRIFGTYQFAKSSGVQAIRHEIRPSLGFSYKPDINKKYNRIVQVDSLKHMQSYSELSTGLFSAATSPGVFGGITYGVDNLLEMKVKDKKNEDSAAKPKKIRLLDGFGFNGSYNLAADSFQWSPISLYLRSTLFEKINITGNATMDLYEVDSLGFPKNRLIVADNKFKPGRISSGSIAMSGSFQSKKAEEKKNEPLPQDQFVTPDEQQRMLDYVRNNPAEFTDFDIPWTVQVSLSFNFYRSYDRELYRFKTTTNANTYLSGDFSLSPKWKIGGNTYFDITNKKIQSLSMFITRDMHCWQMAINITPVGLYKSFTITLNPKSGILRDLRINRSRYFYSQ
jgi:LPS-assembly protein